MLFEFARMEYALKAAGYLVREVGRAEPNWDAFANSITDDLLLLRQKDGRVAAAIDRMIARPPRQQMAGPEGLYWQEPSAPRSNDDMVWVLLCVRRVRNNLFHGGKFNERWFEPQRSSVLIQDSLILLRACRQVSEDVAAAFEK